ncbi:MAG TPA: integrin [Herpetosiphonaceae bacterium]
MLSSTTRPVATPRRLLMGWILIASLMLGSGPIAAVVPPAQQAYLKASNTDAGDALGRSLALSGDTLVIGAPFEDSAATGVDGPQGDNSATNAGAAYVFVRDGDGWRQQAYLKASNAAAADTFGFSVAISGDTIVVGAPGEDSAATGIGGDQGDNSAASAGAAYVFTRTGTTWTQQTYLKASNTGATDNFGHAVALDGTTVIVGAYGEDSAATGVNGDQTDNSAPTAGAAYVFTQSGTTWTQQAYLKATNAQADDFFGASVAVSGATIVAGAFGEDSAATGVDGDQTDNSAPMAGAAYVFASNGAAWTPQAYLKASNAAPGDGFGYALKLSGATLVVGADGEDSAATGINGDQADNSAANAGAAYVVVRNGMIWTQQAYLKASNTGPQDRFGQSMALVGDALLIGAPSEDSAATGVNGNQGDENALDAGAAYLLGRTGTTWTQQAYLKASNTNRWDAFGVALALADTTLIVGAWQEDSVATGINGNQDDNSAAEAGAAYALVLAPAALPPRVYLPLIRSNASVGHP